MARRLQCLLVFLRASRSRHTKLDRPFFEFTSSITTSHLVHELYLNHHGCVAFIPYLYARSTPKSLCPASPVAPVPEKPVTDPMVASLSGYSRSKWVAETLLLQAKKERALCVNVVRVGQLAGDSKIGGWNEKEWLPVLLRGSQVLGVVPERTEVSTHDGC